MKIWEPATRSACYEAQSAARPGSSPSNRAGESPERSNRANSTVGSPAGGCAGREQPACQVAGHGLHSGIVGVNIIASALDRYTLHLPGPLRHWLCAAIIAFSLFPNSYYRWGASLLWSHRLLRWAGPDSFLAAGAGARWGGRQIVRAVGRAGLVQSARPSGPAGVGVGVGEPGGGAWTRTD